MDCVAIIPARYGSTRFPGKPLATLLGRPLIQHVVARCAAVEGIARVVVATDDAAVAKVYGKMFDEIWQASEVELEFRQLGI